jgi:nitrogen regulatory protein PII
MKAVFITYNQAHTLDVNKTLDELDIRGFTRWAETQGRGTEGGEPHYGTHTWPSMNTSILVMLDDEKVPVLLDALKAIDGEAKEQGMRAFVWDAVPGM